MQQCGQDPQWPAMRHHHNIASAPAQLGIEVLHPCDQCASGLAARGCEGFGVCRPNIEIRARNILPGQSLPGTEIQLQQSIVVMNRAAVRQGFGEHGAPASGAAPQHRVVHIADRFDHAGDR